MASRTLISFDWAMKKLLRQKANFVILEGFLTTLLNKEIFIQEILESDSNKNTLEDKFNIVDLLAKDKLDNLFIIEVQYSREVDYFHRMLFATSKSGVEHLKEGNDYGNIRKTYSINLLYFELGQGKDYVYHGTNTFRGIHHNDILQLSQVQKDKFLCNSVHELFPEYYVIQINKFNDLAETSLDEWIYFLKNTEVPEKFSAPGLKEAKNKLQYERMSEKEKNAYDKFKKHKHSESNILNTARLEVETVYKEKLDEAKAREEEAKAREEEAKAEKELQQTKFVQILAADGKTAEQISQLLELDIAFIHKILKP